METRNILLDSDTPGQSLVLHVLFFAGVGGGPSVYVQAGLHANELAGTVALDRLIPYLAAAEAEGRLAGDVTLVPHANPIGLAQSVQDVPLGVYDLNSRIDFNRDFPTEPADRMAGRPVAERLKAHLIGMAEAADVVLDLHGDDEAPVYLFVLESQCEAGRLLARAIGAEVILTEASTDLMSFDLAVLSRWAAQQRAGDRRFAATVELRGVLDVTPEFAETDAAGLYRYLALIGTVVDVLPAITAEEPVIVAGDAAEMILTPVPGALLYNIGVGDRVSDGQLLARILPEAGSPAHEIRAPFRGIVLSRRAVRFLRRGSDVLTLLRYP